MISLKNVNKVYKNGVKAVSDVSLEIKKGEIFGIIGYSGAGKSSLIRLLNGLEKVSSGDVLIAEQDINQISDAELRKARQGIGMIFQHFNLLWSRTVRENISLPLEIASVSKQERTERVDDLIRLVGLEGREDAYPAQLSGGQKQRVGIARALANHPHVLLCDEATSALDPETTDQILDLLVDINKRLGLTICLITHEMHVIQKICNRVAVMEAGKIVETGQVLEVFRSPKQQITKKFVQQLTETKDTTETLQHMLEKFPNGKIIQLAFVGESAEKALISNLIRQFNVEINILQGSISQTTEGAYGTLYIQIIGEPEEITRCIHYAKQQVEVEVMDRV